MNVSSVSGAVVATGVVTIAIGGVVATGVVTIAIGGVVATGGVVARGVVIRWRSENWGGAKLVALEVANVVANVVAIVVGIQDIVGVDVCVGYGAVVAIEPANVPAKAVAILVGKGGVALRADVGIRGAVKVDRLVFGGAQCAKDV